MKFVKNINDIDNIDNFEKPEYRTTDTFRMENTSFELGKNVLVIRNFGRGYKEKILVAYDEIKFTRVKKYTNKIFLLISILSLVLGGGSAYPIFKFFGLWGILSIGLGVGLFAIFFVLYLMSKAIKVAIYCDGGSKIERRCKDTKLFDKINDFFDELFIRRNVMK